MILLYDSMNELKDFDEDWDTLDEEPITDNEYEVEEEMRDFLQSLVEEAELNNILNKHSKTRSNIVYNND